MNTPKRIQAVLALLATGAVAVTVMVSAPRLAEQPDRGSSVAVPEPQAPAGHRPVAPGSYTFIPDGTHANEAPAVGGTDPAAPAGYRPVAPGSYTFVPSDVAGDDGESLPQAPAGYRPVAPGSYTFIPDTD